MTAGRADEASRWVGLQPALPLAAVPDAVFRAKHPASPLAVKDRQIPDRDPEGPGLKRSNAALFNQVPVTQLRLCEWIDSHLQSIAPGHVSRRGTGYGAPPAGTARHLPGERGGRV
jgi:hypothetical protein